MTSEDHQRSDIVGDDHCWIAFRRTPRVCEFFNSNSIFFEHDGPELSPDENGRVIVTKVGVIEQYTLRSGFTSCAMGAFSYCHTPDLEVGMRIGRYCSMGSGLLVFGERHPMEWVTSSNITYAFSPGFSKPHFLRAHEELMHDRWTPLHPPPFGEAPDIGHDVWIGQNVTIARGVTIGTGAVIGAAAVVSKSVEPYAVVAGNPARFIRHRFPEEVRTRLLASKWWELHPDILFRFDRADPVRFLDQLDEAQAAGTDAPCPARSFTWQDMVREIADLSA